MINIEKATQLADLQQTQSKTRRPEKSLSADKIATIAAKATEFNGMPAQQWKKKWLASKKFVLVTIKASSVALPSPVLDKQRVTFIAAAGLANCPVVVDVNKREVGASLTGFVPPVIVVEGKERHQAAIQAGMDYIKAWVGVKAAKRLGIIHADHDFGSNELNQKLQEALREKLAPEIKKEGKKTGDPGAIAPGGYPWITEVYPYERYFVYQWEGKYYKQNFVEKDATRAVALAGDAVEVVQKYSELKGCGMNMQKAQKVDAQMLALPRLDSADKNGAMKMPMPGMKGTKLYAEHGADCDCPTCKAKRMDAEATTQVQRSNGSGPRKKSLFREVFSEELRKAKIQGEDYVGTLRTKKKNMSAGGPGSGVYDHHGRGVSSKISHILSKYGFKSVPDPISHKYSLYHKTAGVVNKNKHDHYVKVESSGRWTHSWGSTRSGLQVGQKGGRTAEGLATHLSKILERHVKAG